MGIRMFCAELDGHLVPYYIGCRAQGIRYSICRTREDRHGVIADPAHCWRQARKEGWRVVPIRVEKVK